MKIFNLEKGMPSVSEAGKSVAKIIRENRNSEKVIKIIHGYGSTGVGGKIKIALHRSLKKRVNSGDIAAFIPGEAFASLIGFDENIKQYKHLIKADSDYKRGNDGITYIIF